jgi:hypothetical protein
VSRTTLAGTTLIERPWQCPRCGARGVVTRRLRKARRLLRARGAAPAPERDTDAHWHAEDEATRMLAMIKCPACLSRAPGAIAGSALRLGVTALGAMILAAVASGALLIAEDLPLAGLLLWLAGPFALGAVREVQRWRIAGRASVLQLKPGPPEPVLPRAVVHKLAAPTSIVPIESSAPEPVEPADEASGPRFLIAE